jgi:hypothetical protein
LQFWLGRGTNNLLPLTKDMVLKKKVLDKRSIIMQKGK